MKKRIGLLVFLLMVLAASSAFAHTHKWTHIKDDPAPTCTSTGVAHYICLENDDSGQPCLQTKTEKLEKIKHKAYVYYEREATCTRQGVREWACRRCRAEWTEILPYAPHSYNSWRTVREATCTEQGLRERFCRNCGHRSTQNTKKLPHPYGEWYVAREATDHSMGIEQHDCATCTAFETREFYPTGTLYEGLKKNESVKALQRFLVENGYLNSKVDGNFAKKTAEAVRNYQRAMGFEPTGIAYPQTLFALFCTNTDYAGNAVMTNMPHVYGDWTILTEAGHSSPGMRSHTCLYCGFTCEAAYYPAGTLLPGLTKNEEVKAMQRLLIEKKIAKTRADGDYGEKTEQYIRDFQRMAGLEVTGICYPETLEALRNWVAY